MEPLSAAFLPPNPMANKRAIILWNLLVTELTIVRDRCALSQQKEGIGLGPIGRGVMANPAYIF